MDKYLTFYSSKVSALLAHEWAQDSEILQNEDTLQILFFNLGNCAACRQESSLEFTKRVADESNTVAVLIAHYPLDAELLIQQLELDQERVLYLPDSIANSVGLLFPHVVAIRLEDDRVKEVRKE